MLDEVLYMTSVRVRVEVDDAWNRFYADWVAAFTQQVPGTRRGSRWRVTAGLVAGIEQVPSTQWPMYLAIQEYRRLDEFVLSRSWRKERTWEPRVRSFDPWFKDLQDYATLNLQKLDQERGDPGGLPPAILASTWTVEPSGLLEFEEWRATGPEQTAVHALTPSATHHYLAALAQLHRHGGPAGELVIPQRHHFEDGGRLCYMSILELSALPSLADQNALLIDLQSGIERWSGIVADRQDTFAEQILAVDR
jgi:hypothetical protein